MPLVVETTSLIKKLTPILRSQIQARPLAKETARLIEKETPFQCRADHRIGPIGGYGDPPYNMLWFQM